MKCYQKKLKGRLKLDRRWFQIRFVLQKNMNKKDNQRKPPVSSESKFVVCNCFSIIIGIFRITSFLQTRLTDHHDWFSLYIFSQTVMCILKIILGQSTALLFSEKAVQICAKQTAVALEVAEKLLTKKELNFKNNLNFMKWHQQI